MPKHLWSRTMALGVVTLAIGCQRQAATVDGQVTLDGQFLTHGTVTFHPTDTGRASYGTIGPEGSYAMKTGDDVGLGAGSYEVTIVSLQPDTPAAGPFGMPTPGKHITPTRYANRQTSGLTAEVEPGANRLDFALRHAD